MADGFASINPEEAVSKHQLCILLLDTSGSMETEDRIGKLNTGLRVFSDELKKSTETRNYVEVGVITFGGTVHEHPPVQARMWDPPNLTTDGLTPMGEAMEVALRRINEKKDYWRANGHAWTRPWVFLISDGYPTDDWQAPAKAAYRAEKDKRAAIFCVGVGDTADEQKLQSFSSRVPVKLDGAKWTEMFTWLKNSVESTSRSHDESDESRIDNPTAQAGGAWAKTWETV